MEIVLLLEGQKSSNYIKELKTEPLSKQKPLIVTSPLQVSKFQMIKKLLLLDQVREIYKFIGRTQQLIHITYPRK